MDFGGVNYLAVVLATIAAFAFGAAYYGTLAKPWMKAARIDPTKTSMSPALLVTTFLCELVMAWVLAGLVLHLGSGQPTVATGLLAGFLVWLGFMAPVTVVNQRYSGFGWDLSIIDIGHWLGVALIMGVVIGWMGA